MIKGDINSLRNDSYCIAIYDISENRVQKVNKVFKKFLFHKQNSIFIGKISKSEAIALYNELKNIISEDEDEICLWFLKNSNEIREITLGERNSTKHTSEDDYIF